VKANLPLTAAMILAVASTALPIPATSAQTGATSNAPAAADSALPIRKITLYRSGVGAFERQDLISGNRTVQLRFKTDQINDILKSMVLLDLDGGRIGPVTYGSKEPLARRLTSFAVDISDAPSLDVLFSRLRGSPVRLTTGEGQYEGSILSVEPRITVIEAEQNPGQFKEWYVNIVTSSGVRSIATSRISTFELTDPALNEELNRALATLAEYRADRVKTVDLSFLGGPGEPRRVAVAYVQEMPVWKTSYRLVLPEGDTKDDKLTMQGWAIVENTTDEDWNEVRLTLASGRPVGFTMDLYEPLFAFRPMVPVPMAAGVGPRIFEAGQMAGEEGVAREANQSFEVGRRAVAEHAGKKPAAAASAQAFGQPMMDAAPPMDLSGSDFVNYAASAAASAGEIGEQFVYTLDTPVTLERQRSAMLPILTADISGRRVSIYNHAAMPDHPMRGVQLTNDSGLHLMPGPIAVYDGGAYAGDAQIPHTSRNDTRLLSYAVDLDVHAQMDAKGENNLVKVRIVDGVLHMSMKERQSRVFSFRNHDAARDRTLLVEHPKSYGWELKEPAKADEVTENLYRFEVAVAAGKDARFTVAEERTYLETYELLNYDLATLMVYVKDGRASQAVVDAFKKGAELRGAMSQTEQRLAELNREVEAITQDQLRVRENMKSIDRTTELHARYMKKLTEQESRLEDIGEERTRLETELRAQREALESYLRNLDVE